jgi:regulator of RNase E activity RraA
MKNSPLNISRRFFLGASGAMAALGLPALSIAGQKTETAASHLLGANVTLIASAMRKVGLNPKIQSMTTEMRPLVDTGETMIGPAVITKWETGLGATTQDDARQYMFETLDNAPKGAVWVNACDSKEIYSLFGDVIILACKRDGMAGAITDNGCRDIAAIKRLGFPVFARSAVPFGPGPEDSIRPVAANVPVVCGGVKVRPGDLIAADIDGIIVIPKEKIAELEKAIPVRLAREEGIRVKIRKGLKLAIAYTR